MGAFTVTIDGVVYKEIDDPTLALQDEITELKKQLEIAKEALETSKNEFNFFWG